MTRSLAYNIFGWVITLMSLTMPLLFLIPLFLLGMFLILFARFIKNIESKEQYFYNKLKTCANSISKLKELEKEIFEFANIQKIGKKYNFQFIQLHNTVLKRIHFLNHNIQHENF